MRIVIEGPISVNLDLPQRELIDVIRQLGIDIGGFNRTEKEALIECLQAICESLDNLNQEIKTMSGQQSAGFQSVQQAVDQLTQDVSQIENADDSMKAYIAGLPNVIATAVAEAQASGASPQQLQALQVLSQRIQATQQQTLQAIMGAPGQPQQPQPTPPQPQPDPNNPQPSPTPDVDPNAPPPNNPQP